MGGHVDAVEIEIPEEARPFLHALVWLRKRITRSEQRRLRHRHHPGRRFRASMGLPIVHGVTCGSAAALRWNREPDPDQLDHLSGGRLVLGVGIGGDWHREYSGFGEDPDPKRHGAMLDEALAVIAGLWGGEAFSFAGDHYRVDEVRFRPAPLQRPRIPIWVAGLWPRRRPFRRAARWDGVFAITEREGFAATAADVGALRAFVAEHRAADAPFAVVVQAETRGRSPDVLKAEIAALADAGATWWLHNVNPGESLDETRAIIGAGPPVP